MTEAALNEGNLSQKTIWFLVADGEKAQIFLRQRRKARIPLPGNAKHHHYEEKMETTMVPVTGARWKAESLDDFEAGGDAVGRVFESGASGRHAVAPHMNIHEELKLRFMYTLAQHINAACLRREFSNIVLIAPPNLLGELKKHLNPQVQQSVLAELPKVLTRTSGTELAQHVQTVPEIT